MQINGENILYLSPTKIRQKKKKKIKKATLFFFGMKNNTETLEPLSNC